MHTPPKRASQVISQAIPRFVLTPSGACQNRSLSMTGPKPCFTVPTSLQRWRPKIPNMKISTSSWFAVLTLVSGSAFAQIPPAPSAAPTPTNTNGAPKIHFQNTTYDFGKLSSGQPARHDFIFTNVGNAVLEITGVRPACGCTAAGEWSKTVEPGKTGTIPL
jgi:hypothetical protein